MRVDSLLPLIQIEFDASGMPGSNEMKAALNEVIRDLNSNEMLQRVFLTISGEDGDWNVDDIDVNVDDIDVNVDDMGSFTNGFSWDATNNILTLPDTVQKIDDIYIDDVKQMPMSYSRLLNSYNEDEDWTYLTYGTYQDGPAYGYNCVGNTIHFNRDITGNVLKCVMYKEYDEIQTINNVEQIVVPTYFKQHLISGAIVILGSRNKNYIDENVFARHYTKAEKALRGIRQRSISREHTAGLDIY